MKGLYKKAFSSILVLSFGVMIFGCGKKKEKTDAHTDLLDYKTNYGYKYFVEKNENQAKLYVDAYTASLEFKNSMKDLNTSYYTTLFEAKCDTYSLTLNETRQVLEVFTYENPLFFFINEIDYEDDGDTVKLEVYKDYYLSKDRKNYYKMIDEGLKTFDSKITSYKTDFDKVRFIYEYIRENMDYCFEDEGDLYYAHNILGFFDNSEGVCETYAKVFNLFCKKSNVESIPAFSENHVWNMAKVYDRWYMFDATKDFFGTSEEYYFRMNDEAPAFEDIMIDAPKTPTSGLCYSEFILYEDDDIEICRSHSIDEIYEHFNGGDYIIYLDTIGAKTGEEKTFYIDEIKTNYNTLKIMGTNVNPDPNSPIVMFDATILVTGSYRITKDVQFRQVNFDSSLIYHNPQNTVRASWSVPVGVTVVITSNAGYTYFGFQTEENEDSTVRGTVIAVLD